MYLIEHILQLAHTFRLLIHVAGGPDTGIAGVDRGQRGQRPVFVFPRHNPLFLALVCRHEWWRSLAYRAMRSRFLDLG